MYEKPVSATWVVNIESVAVHRAPDAERLLMVHRLAAGQTGIALSLLDHAGGSGVGIAKDAEGGGIGGEAPPHAQRVAETRILEAERAPEHLRLDPFGEARCTGDGLVGRQFRQPTIPLSAWPRPAQEFIIQCRPRRGQKLR